MKNIRISNEKTSTCEALTGHHKCLFCGERNPWSFGLCFAADGEKTVHTRFQAHPGLQGYNGILHGGIISALLDAAMTHCLFHQKIQAVTGELNVRFLNPVPCCALLDIKAWILSERRPLFRVASEIRYEARIMARAEAKFMEFPI